MCVRQGQLPSYWDRCAETLACALLQRPSEEMRKWTDIRCAPIGSNNTVSMSKPEQALRGSYSGLTRQIGLPRSSVMMMQGMEPPARQRVAIDNQFTSENLRAVSYIDPVAHE